MAYSKRPEQLLQNIIINTNKFGHSVSKISISVTENADTAKVQVSEN